MRITWSPSVKSELDGLPGAEAGQIRSEVKTAFTDSIPSNAVNLPHDRLMLELPCGWEVECDRIGDGVRILDLHS